MKKFQPHCLATGIGSLPHPNLDDALELIFQKLCEIPHWPQLPKWGEEEGFINQYIEPLVRLGLVSRNENGDPYFDLQSENWLENITEFYEVYLRASQGEEDALNFFSFPESGGAGFYGFIDKLKKDGIGTAKCLKGQISGPLTLALILKDENKKPAYYVPELRELLVKTLAMMAKWQTVQLKKFNLPVLMFVDDPGLSGYGVSTHITLKRDDIIEDLNFIYAQIHQTGGITGSHSCAGIDWTLLTDSNVDIISFDAYNYFSTLGVYHQNVKEFLEKGGILAWGIVPTSQNVWDEEVNTLADKFFQQVNHFVNKGLSKDLLLSQSLITPSCGTGTLSVEMAERICALTNQLSEFLRK